MILRPNKVLTILILSVIFQREERPRGEEEGGGEQHKVLQGRRHLEEPDRGLRRLVLHPHGPLRPHPAFRPAGHGRHLRQLLPHGLDGDDRHRRQSLHH